MNVAKAWCVEVDCKRTRSMLAKFRGEFAYGPVKFSSVEKE